MKILFLDIETSPHLGYFWRLFKENIGVGQLVKPSSILSWAAKWRGEKQVMFASVNEESPKAMLKKIAKLLDEADVVVHFYGKNFDIPTLNKEFIVHGIKQPSPYKQVDLKEVSARVFKFASNKLEFVAKFLGVGFKIKTDFDLWIDCMNGDQKAWGLMKKYNIQDTVLLEKLYDKMLPWIPQHPNHAAFEDGMVCPQCGGQHFIRRGFQLTQVNKYVRYQCQAEGCGKYFRGNKAVKSQQKEKFVHVV